MERADVICVGNSAVDVPLYPVDEKILTTDSYPVDRIVPRVGGSGTNVSTVLSRLGVKTRLITMLGKDMLGEFLIDHCKQCGIDTSGIVRSELVDTPLSVGLVKRDGERNFVVSRSSSTFHFSAEHVDTGLFRGAKLLTVASIFIMPLLDDAGLSRLFLKAKEQGLILCADMMRSRTGERMEAIARALTYLDYFFANYEEASFLTGEDSVPAIAQKLLEAGVRHVIIKLGKQGCYIQRAGFAQYCPAYINPAPVDTIGAGDNFAAGFIAALLDGRSLTDCARFANATASVSVGASGAVTGVKDKGQVLRVFADTPEA